MGTEPIIFKFFKMLSDRINITLQYNKKGQLSGRPFIYITNFKTTSLQPFQQADVPNPAQFLPIHLNKDLALYNLLVNHQVT